MFQGLADRLQATLERLRGRGRLSEQDVTQALREVRMALLEADVNFSVAKDFIARIRERSVGQEVLSSLTPGQQVVKIVHEELTALLGGEESKIATASSPPTVIMLVGLQGSGKTTTAGKLAMLLRKQGKKPLLAAADVYRPAAVKQLTVLGEQLDIPVFSMGTSVSPVDIVKGAREHASRYGRDTLIVDTAGRLHVDDDLMEELKQIKAVNGPHEILLVVDAMTGQDAVQIAESFHAALGIDGLIMTKMDGDTRGGAALSVKSVTGRPIKFAGTGEKLDAFEVFHPERVASRILGMGDMLTLIERAQATVDMDKAREMEKKIRAADFTLEDFLEQLKQVKNMGPIDQLMGMIPGMNKLQKMQGGAVDEKEMVKVEAIIYSMTPTERRDPALIDGSRRRRIARGSGTTVQDVNRLLKQFDAMKKMMKQFGRQGKKGKGMDRNLPFLR